MASDQADCDGCVEQTMSAEEVLAPLDLSVYPAGDSEGGLHTQNDPTDPYQRDNIIERRGKVDVRCEHSDIVHGYFSDDDDEPCSLIVLEFQFSPNGLARRIKEAHISVRFSAMEQDQKDPVVADMYPRGSFSVCPTTQRETRVLGGGLSLDGGVAGMQILSGEFKAEKTVERNVSDATTVRGSIDLVGRLWGPKNAVSWTLLENHSTTSGVVRKMRAAVLLKRKDMKPFSAKVTMKVDADTTTKIGSAFRRDPKDDDVWYNPEREPPSTDRLQTYDVNNLGKLTLKSLSEVTFLAVLKDTEREV